MWFLRFKLADPVLELLWEISLKDNEELCILGRFPKSKMTVQAEIQTNE